MNDRNAICCLAALASLVNGCQSSPLLTPHQVKGICSSLAARLGVPFEAGSAKLRSTTVGPMGIRRWTVQDGQRLYIVDDEFGYVSTFQDADALVAARSRSSAPTRFFTTAEDGWLRAEILLARLDSGAGLVRWRFRDSRAPLGQPRSQPGCVSFSFQAMAHGKLTGGDGNGLSMTLDEVTGRLAWFTQIKGWTYDPPDASLSEAEAKAAAFALVRLHHPGLAVEFRSARLTYVAPYDGFGATLTSPLRAAMRVRWAYFVRFDKCHLYVDAQTGESLGGNRLNRSR